ncbi:three-Cys-motif partner protein TcmP [Salinactinospora qingdaonensis]|uniref:GMT-like wHTH domain-containing protein n=1 Tax=Salinactinospora qingdaonensis TaxID=702744 RepID=A0ABP7F8A8_9ACTN
MAVPEKAVWKLSPHTEAKHAMLRSYLETWLAKLAGTRGIPPLTYAEGFAGPGVYEGEKPGSPVIALDVFLKQAHRLRRDQHLNVLLIEEDARRVEELRRQVAAKLAPHGGSHPKLNVTIQHADASALLSDLTEESRRDEPFFAFLDGWGGPDHIPFETARHVAQRRGGEVLVTFEASHLWRFVDDEERAEVGDRCFGSQEWRDVKNQPSNKKQKFLIDAYQKSLKRAGFEYVTSFEMILPKKSRLHLVFGTKHIEGLRVMKKAMWKVDPHQGGVFHDPRFPGQLSLDLEAQADLSHLRKVILDKLEEGPISIDSLREFALHETVYREKHAREVAQKLLREKLITSTGGANMGSGSILEMRSDDPASSAGPQQEALF